MNNSQILKELKTLRNIHKISLDTTEKMISEMESSETRKPKVERRNANQESLIKYRNIVEGYKKTTKIKTK